MSAKITSDQATILNKMTADGQKIGLGDNLKELGDYSPVLLVANVNVASNSTAFPVTIPFAMKITLVTVQCRAASGSGTATLRKVTTAITDAMVCAVDKTVNHCGTLDDAQTTLAAGDNVNVITNGANDRGIVCIYGYRL